MKSKCLLITLVLGLGLALALLWLLGSVVPDVARAQESSGQNTYSSVQDTTDIIAFDDTGVRVAASTVTTQELGTWNVVRTGTEYLRSVAMVSANDGWAVGFERRASNGAPKGCVILHWNGSGWQSVDDCTSPMLSVAMVSADDGWVVGNGEVLGGRISRWNGNTWSRVYTGTNGLESVAMVSADDGWAVGGSDYDGTIVRWNGSAWSGGSSIPDTNLKSVAMVSASDVWAVGGYRRYLEFPYSESGYVTGHWDGSIWSWVVGSPTTSLLHSVAMVSTNDGWMVGEYGHIRHWNGSAWSFVSSPTGCTLRSVAMVSADDGWAVGGSGCTESSVILHWDGNEWSKVDNPTTEWLYSVAMISANEGWAVGEGGTILHYLKGHTVFLPLIQKQTGE
jgi:hypothetical protein